MAAIDPLSLPAPRLSVGAVLGPMVPPMGPAMIACIADTPGLRLRHIRADGLDGPVDRLEVHPPMGTPQRTLAAAIWGGPVLEHFGHFVAECIHRLWAAHRPDIAALPVVMQVAAGVDPWRHRWFGEVMALCGLDRARVRIVDAPVAVERLFVPEQGRALGGVTLLPGYTAPRPPAPRAHPDAAVPLYVSRSGHIQTGTYLGETLVEALLARAGFAILRPEAMGIADLVARLACAPLIVFAEGSAIHNLELCGPVAARVFVIGRRIGVKRRFGPLLDTLAADWRAFPAGEAALTLDWRDGRPRADRGCSLPDLAALVRALADFTGIALPVPDAAAARRAQADDLLRFLLHPASGTASGDAALGHALRMLRDSPLVAPLLRDQAAVPPTVSPSISSVG